MSGADDKQTSPVSTAGSDGLPWAREDQRPAPRRRKLGARHAEAWSLNVLAMGLNPSPSGETFRFFDLLEFGDGEVPNEFAQPL